ncbi:MAG TPA: type I methionyl aminopeptidase [Byssovorax sp.]
MSSNNVTIYTLRDVEALRVVGQHAAETLLAVGDMIRAGITTDDINTFVHEDTLKRGGTCAPLNYHGFPKSVCTSVNDVVCHGIPGPRVLEDGDIINVDVTTVFGGYFGDTSATFYIGNPSPEAKHVTEVSRRSLELGIAQVREGARLGDIGAAIQDFAEGEGCSVVRAFVGHGCGRRFHEKPQVSHVRPRVSDPNPRLKAGMVFTIEPMINVGTYDVEVQGDGWTALTADRSLSAQFEHQLVVTKTGCEVLTRRKRPLARSEIFPSPFSAAAAL